MKKFRLLRDKRYVLFYLLTATIIAVLLAIEELLDADYERLSDVFIEFITDIPLFFILCFLISSISRPIIRWLNSKFPWETKSFKRLSYEVLIVVVLMGFFTTVASIATDVTWFNYMDDTDDLLDDDSKFEVLTMLMFFIGISFVFAFQEYLKLNEDKNQISSVAKDLEKQNLKSQYEALKNQVNPHFLFNSLNVLSSLIYKDIQLSDQFIRKFSEVFRYVLELNQQELVTLKEELKFIDSYIFLQKIRHGDCLRISQKVPATHLGKHIPPMALQIVTENAFKHNVISEMSPLEIHIYSEGENLMVKNTYAARKNGIESTGLGQKNLVDRYQLMESKLPEFYIEDHYYVAELPLLTLNTNGSSDH